MKKLIISTLAIAAVSSVLLMTGTSEAGVKKITSTRNLTIPGQLTIMGSRVVKEAPNKLKADPRLLEPAPNTNRTRIKNSDVVRNQYGKNTKGTKYKSRWFRYYRFNRKK